LRGGEADEAIQYPPEKAGLLRLRLAMTTLMPENILMHL